MKGDMQGVCSDSASFDLPAAVLAACVQEVQTALEIALVRREDRAGVTGRGDGAVIGLCSLSWFLHVQKYGLMGSLHC